MIDFFDLKTLKNEELIKIWLIENNSKIFPILAFKDEKDNISLRLANRVKKIEKLTRLAHSNSVDEYRKIGQVLGVDET